MRSFALSLCALAAACSGRSGAPGLPADAISADAQAATAVAASGVECEPTPPPAAVAACVGKAEKDACTVTKGDDTFQGTCLTTPSGVLACAPTPRDDGPIAAAI